MTEQPMHAYAVSLVFGTGPIVANVVVAPSPEAAAAIIMYQFMKAVQPKEELTGVAVVPIAPEWLSRAKDAVEGRERGQVLHLVPTPGAPMPVSRDQQWEAQAAEDEAPRVLREGERLMPYQFTEKRDLPADVAAAQSLPWQLPQQLRPQPPIAYCSRHPLVPIRDGICSACAPPLSGGAA